MITHTPLLREAEAFSVPWGQPLCQGLKGKAQNRFWSLGKELISIPPDVQGEKGDSPWLSVSWQRALWKEL